MSKQKELVQYFVVNTDLGMSAGKIAAQVGHASMLIALRDQYQENFQVWKEIAMKKIVLSATEDRMRNIIEENPTVVRIIDKGFTEIEPNSLTVIGFPAMTRKEAYKWVHGLQTLNNQGMSYDAEQSYIKEESAGKKGIFYLPKLGKYSASILVENQHPVTVLEGCELIDDCDKIGNCELMEERVEPYIENGDLGYLIGEIMFASGLKPVGEFYAYKIKGENTHSHSLNKVYDDAVNYYDTFEFEEPINDYFSNNQIEIIKAIIEYQKSAKSV